MELTMCHFALYLYMRVKVLVAQSCPTLCDPMDCSPPGSSAHGILQARILGWIANSFLQSIFPTQGSNPTLLHCRQILYCLSHQGSYVCMYCLLFMCIDLFNPSIKIVSVYCHLTHEKQGLEQTCQSLKFTKLLSNCDKA